MKLEDVVVGQWVIYRPAGGEAPPEDGEVVTVGDRYVMVRYAGDRGAKATRAEDLEPGVVP